ncbi:uncharacterized protein LOC128211916 [Mya arenaria]|uniref:uncharacterized protein LOC128211916 n=1 Tax=Mya arenaria TaxID=6604 RepID=UPI0022E3400D|nr:uncharacterized protein LOC128211916 [Mya arenaria]
MRGLERKGTWQQKQRADPFTSSEIQQLYENELHGAASPISLTNTIWLNNTMHLGLRGRQEHLTMLWGDLELSQTSDGVCYLAFTERATKTRNGVAGDHRQYVPKLFEQPGDPNCPVRLYQLYNEKRPPQMSAPETRFYVALNPNFGKGTESNDLWFINQNLGKNKLGQLAKTMSEQAGFQAMHVNHSARKTCISNLLDAGCFPTEVAQLTGHKNLMSLNHYHTNNIEKQQNMSNILHICKRKEPVTNPEPEPITSMEEFDDDDNQELVAASQEIEQALSSIQTYEEIPVRKPTHDEAEQVLDLPIKQSPGGTLTLQKIMKDPQSLFNGCTFNGPISINLRN